MGGGSRRRPSIAEVSPVHRAPGVDEHAKQRTLRPSWPRATRPTCVSHTNWALSMLDIAYLTIYVDAGALAFAQHKNLPPRNLLPRHVGETSQNRQHNIPMRRCRVHGNRNKERKDPTKAHPSLTFWTKVRGRLGDKSQPIGIE